MLPSETLPNFLIQGTKTFLKKQNGIIFEYFRSKNIFEKHRYASSKASNIEYLRSLSRHHEVVSGVTKIRIPQL